MNTLEQEYLAQLTNQLQRIAQLLQGDPHAGFYKHAVLNMIFLKYVADTFDARCRQLQQQLDGENWVDWPDDPSLFHKADILWIPRHAHWRIWCDQLVATNRCREPQQQCTLVIETMDQALRAIEQSNVRYQGVLQPISHHPPGSDRLLELIDVFNATEFVQQGLPDVGPKPHHRHILRYVYEFCLRNMFAAT